MKNRNSFVASLIFHTGLLIGLIGFKSAHILVPSRADGIEVSLINSTEVAPIAKNVEQPDISPPTETLKEPADINIKANDKKPLPQPNKSLQPVVAKNSKVAPTQQKPKKITPNRQINDLLKDITGSQQQSTGKTKAKATHGANGSSDTTNMLNNYADLVIERIRPFVIIPDDIISNQVAVVEVTLLPNMSVYSVKLIKSSTNFDYDDNIIQAINRVRVFPPLPDAAKFTDYRILRLTFKPE